MLFFKLLILVQYCNGKPFSLRANCKLVLSCALIVRLFQTQLNPLRLYFHVLTLDAGRPWWPVAHSALWRWAFFSCCHPPWPQRCSCCPSRSSRCSYEPSQQPGPRENGAPRGAWVAVKSHWLCWCKHWWMEENIYGRKSHTLKTKNLLDLEVKHDSVWVTDERECEVFADKMSRATKPDTSLTTSFYPPKQSLRDRMNMSRSIRTLQINQIPPLLLSLSALRLFNFFFNLASCLRHVLCLIRLPSILDPFTPDKPSDKVHYFPLCVWAIKQGIITHPCLRVGKCKIYTPLTCACK